MAPSAIYEPLVQRDILKNDILKIQKAPLAYRNDTWKKPVADDFMYAFKYNFPLPTHNEGSDVLDFTQDDEASADIIAEQFLKKFEQIIQSRDAKEFANLFLDSGKSALWSDLVNSKTDDERCLERQSRFHLGLSFVQHSTEHRKSSLGPLSSNTNT